MPSIISHFFLLLATVTGVLPGNLKAETTVSGDLSRTAAARREAVLQLTAGKAKDAIVSFGVFVSRDGLALVDMQALVSRDRPKVMVHDGSFINFGRILGIFPEQELALMKFDYSPRLSLEVAKAEPAVNDTVALVNLNRHNPWDATVSPVCGPVMVKRSELTPNSRVLRFTKVMSIGAGLSDAQRNTLGPGRFAINHDGQLIAFTHGVRPGDGQTLITLAPVTGLRNQIEALAKQGQDIGFPVPDSSNPIDPASIDPEFHPMNLAYIRQDVPETRRLLKTLRSRYPESFLLKCRLADIGGDGSGGSSLDYPEPQPGDPPGQQVAMWQIRAAWLANSQRLEESVKARQKAIELSPKDFGADRFLLGDLLVYLERREEAEKIFQEIHPIFSDDIRFLQKFNLLKLGQLKFDESKKLEQRITELEAIYLKR